MPQADAEGRVLQLKFNNFHLINTYFPSGSSGDERQAYKMIFLDEYLAYLSAQFNIPKANIVLAGDYNICHKAIDIHDPKGNKDSSGFYLKNGHGWINFLKPVW